MARARRAEAGPARLAEDNPQTWLTDEDRRAVEVAGTSPTALAALVGARALRFQVLPAKHRQRFALGLLAHRRRVKAIHAWADAAIVPRHRAVAYFVDTDPGVKP